MANCLVVMTEILDAMCWTCSIYFVLWDIIDIILLFEVLKAFLPSMITKNHGHIITIASSAGLFGVAGLVDCYASKYGAIGIHEALAEEISFRKCDGIHTTCVCPYFIDTGMFEGVKTRWASHIFDVSHHFVV